MHKTKPAAVIDIGSSAVRMHISQWNGRETVTLDRLEKPTQIGKEVFSTGYISFDAVRSLSAALSGFCEKAREYGITSVHTVATTALREASNQAYVLDHLATRNKLQVDVLEDTEVSALIIGAMKNSGYIHSDNMLLVYSGTGTTDFALLKDEKTAFTHSMQTGLLKIAEMLREVSDFSRHIEYVAGEYLSTFLTRGNRMRDFWQADGLLFGTGDLQPLCRLLDTDNDGGVTRLSGDMVMRAYESCRLLSSGRICELYNLTPQQGGILYAMLALLSELAALTGVKYLLCTQISLADAAVDLLIRPRARRDYNENLREGAVSSALDLAARYQCDLEHCGHVAGTALYLFENLKGLHGLSKKQGLLLHVACILHESGHYANATDSQEASFSFVKDAQIYGFRSEETLLAANIIAPESLLGIARGAQRGGALGGEDVLAAAKMHALLHLADALDYSHKQKAEIRGVAVEDDRLAITVDVREDFSLEQWMFRQSAPMFREIFGVVPQLNIHNTHSLDGKA